jgi:hypothetical protein
MKKIIFNNPMDNLRPSAEIAGLLDIVPEITKARVEYKLLSELEDLFPKKSTHKVFIEIKKRMDLNLSVIEDMEANFDGFKNE